VQPTVASPFVSLMTCDEEKSWADRTSLETGHANRQGSGGSLSLVRCRPYRASGDDGWTILENYKIDSNTAKLEVLLIKLQKISSCRCSHITEHGHGNDHSLLIGISSLLLYSLQF
jgi:hypothetical protein